MIKIDAIRYYQLGLGSFIIIGICNLISLIISINNSVKLNIFAIIASATFILFYFFTAGFFYYLVKSTPGVDIKQESGKDLEESIEEAIKEYGKS